MNANPMLLQRKYSRVVALFAKKTGLTLGEALDFFYHSFTYQLMRDGVSDMHCMSDGYLAEELNEEYLASLEIGNENRILKRSEATVLHFI